MLLVKTKQAKGFFIFFWFLALLESIYYSPDVSFCFLLTQQQTMYNDNQSLPFHSGYGFDTQMAYGQFSPLPSPLSPIMLDGQLYSPQQFQVSPYFTQPVSPSLPHVTSAHSISQTDIMMPGNNSGQEGLNDSVLLGPGSGYYVHYGSFDGGNSSGNSSLGFYNFQGEFGSGEQFSNRSNSSDMGSYFSPLTSGAVYPHQPVGILGSYENNVRQVCFLSN